MSSALRKSEGAGQHRRVEAIERHLLGAGADAGFLEHRLQRNADPAGIAHRTVGELRAEHAWRRKSATVTRALIHRHHFDGLRERLQLIERQAERTLDQTLHREAVRVRVDDRREVGQVIAHEECIVRSDRTLVEHRERRFQMRRTRVHADQRALARVTHQRARAVGKRDPFAGALRRESGQR